MPPQPQEPAQAALALAKTQKAGPRPVKQPRSRRALVRDLAPEEAARRRAQLAAAAARQRLKTSSQRIEAQAEHDQLAEEVNKLSRAYAQLQHEEMTLQAMEASNFLAADPALLMEMDLTRRLIFEHSVFISAMSALRLPIVARSTGLSIPYERIREAMEHTRFECLRMFSMSSSSPCGDGASPSSSQTNSGANGFSAPIRIVNTAGVIAEIRFCAGSDGAVYLRLDSCSVGRGSAKSARDYFLEHLVEPPTVTRRLAKVSKACGGSGASTEADDDDQAHRPVHWVHWIDDDPKTGGKLHTTWKARDTRRETVEAVWEATEKHALSTLGPSSLMPPRQQQEHKQHGVVDCYAVYRTGDHFDSRPEVSKSAIGRFAMQQSILFWDQPNQDPSKPSCTRGVGVTKLPYAGPYRLGDAPPTMVLTMQARMALAVFRVFTNNEGKILGTVTDPSRQPNAVSLVLHSMFGSC